jgi:hypothetical protein
MKENDTREGILLPAHKTTTGGASQKAIKLSSNIKQMMII